MECNAIGSDAIQFSPLSRVHIQILPLTVDLVFGVLFRQDHFGKTSSIRCKSFSSRIQVELTQTNE